MRPEIEQEMQLLRNLSVCACVCAFGANPMSFSRHMLTYLDVLLQYVGEESGKKNFFLKILKKTIHEEKQTAEKTRYLLHLLGKNVFG